MEKGPRKVKTNRLISLLTFVAGLFYMLTLVISLVLLSSSAHAASKKDICDAFRMSQFVDTQPRLSDIEFCRAIGGQNCEHTRSRYDAVCSLKKDDVNNKAEGCEYASNIGDAICRSYGGKDCGYVSSLGQGLCVVGGGGADCRYTPTLAQGICSAFQGDNCRNVVNIAQGQCAAMRGADCLKLTSEEDILRWKIKFEEFCR